MNWFPFVLSGAGMIVTSVLIISSWLAMFQPCDADVRRTSPSYRLHCACWVQLTWHYFSCYPCRHAHALLLPPSSLTGINILLRLRAQHSCQTPLCCHSLMCWPEFSRLHKSLLLFWLHFHLHNYFLGEFSAQQKPFLQCSKLPSAFETSKSYDDLEVMQVDSPMPQLDDSYLKIPEKMNISVEVCLWSFFAGLEGTFRRQLILPHTDLYLYHSWMTLP